MKRRRGDTSLPLVNVAIAGNQSLAEQNLHALLRAFFDEVLRLHDQHFANQFRVVHQDDLTRTDTVARHAVEVGRQIFEEPDRIARPEETAEEIERQVALQARRETITAALFDDPAILDL